MSFEPVFDAPCYIQIPAHSMPRAAAFYSSVLSADFGNQEGINSTEDRAHAGFTFEGPLKSIVSAGLIKVPGTTEEETLQGGRKYGFSNVYFYADDMEASLDKVRAAGGVILIERTPVPGAHSGWFSDFRDTEGNFFGLYTINAAKS